MSGSAKVRKAQHEAGVVQTDDQLRARAAALADEIASGLRRGQAIEWLEEVLGGALIEVARGERERCAEVATRRIEMWDSSLRRLESGRWPAASLSEARARLNEARALADALRVSIALPPER